MTTFYEWQEAPKAEFAVIGDPIAHSWSPQMHHAAYLDLHLPYRYHAIRVPLSEFNEALSHLRKLGYIGVNVTTPLKEAAYHWAKEIEPHSKKYKALNTLNLQKRAGTNTDAPGFIQTLKNLNLAPSSNVLLLGAGGSAQALARALTDEGFQLFIFNRTYEHAKQMLHELQIKATLLAKPVLDDIYMVINATTTSLGQSTLLLPWDKAPKSCVAYDLMYSKKPTPFLKSAAQTGKRTYDGKQLLVEQGALSFEWWLHLKAPKGTMFDSIQDD